MKILIGNRPVGSDEPVYIIAEAGVNHNGSVDLAKKLIDAAVRAGADAVKFQTFNAEKIVTDNAEKASYQKVRTDPRESQLVMLKNLELSPNEFLELSQYAVSRNIQFLSTPFDPDSVDLLEKIGVPAYKIGSGDLTNYLLIKKVIQKQKPVILSSGMATLKEIKDVLRFIENNGGEEVALLHCTTGYPAAYHELNLRSVLSLRKRFRIPIGYSDHTPGIEASIVAVALGACIIEKHITLSKNLEGPDHSASLEPTGFRELVQAIRNAEAAMGTGIKRPSPSEKSMCRVVRRSLVAVRDIRKGSIITEDMLAAKRPGTGISPRFIDDIIGKKVKKDIKRDELIRWNQIQ